MRRIIILTFCFLSLPLFFGCLGRFSANQGRRQAARSADYYVRTYAEPDLLDAYADNTAEQAEMRQTTREARNDIADTIVRSGNERQKSRVGVNDRGYLTNER